jgi:branched-chain amino acid transport system substrate-binding protein
MLLRGSQMNNKALTKMQAIMIIIVVVAAISGITWYFTRPPAKAEPIKIGLFAPLSPPGAYEAGRMMKMAAELAVNEINAAGGILGREVILLVYDNKGTPDEAVKALDRAVLQDKVCGIVQDFHSSPTLAAIEASQKYNVPQVVGYAWADAVTAKRYKNVFRVGPWVSEIGDVLCRFMEWIIKARGIKNIGILYETSDWGVSQTKYLTSYIDEHKLPVNYKTEAVEFGATDLTPQLISLKAFKADLVFAFVCFHPGDTLLIKQAWEVGLCPGAILVHGWPVCASPDYWEITGEYGVGVLFLTDFHKNVVRTATGKHFTDAFKKAYGIAPTAEAYYTYDCVRVLLDAIKRAGSTDYNAIISALEKTNIEGFYDIITFETQGTEGPIYHQNTRHSWCIVQYHKYKQPYEEAVIIWPPDIATGEFIWPPSGG